MVSVFKALVFLLCVGKHFSQELFAVIGGASCAENLFYGPQSITETGSADGNYPFFLSTSTASKDVAHSQWLQIVTSDGVKELFRIYWTFNTKKTLAARFAGAVSAGEVVDYEVVVAETGASYSYSGFWRFSSNAAITANIFATPTTQCCFSADDGVWGAGIGTIDGDGLGYQNTLFWGQGNWDTSDSACKTVFRAGEAYTEYVAAKSFMYYYATPYPTAAPTLQPTIAPTVPGDLAGNNDTYELFAVVGGYSCAEALYYGPQAITLAGSADGNYPYFLSTSTASRDIAHREWLQIVTMEGGQTELFRIYWTFTGSAKTLAQRIIDAVRYGEDVDYLVLEADTGAEYRYSGKWWFSDASRVSATTFNTATTQCCFSADDGVWGAGTGHVDGDGSTTRYSSINFWGVGNWESTDFNGCFKIFKNGVAYGGLYGDTTKSFMYYDPVSPPSPQPTEIPTAAPSISFAPTHFIPLELFAVVGGAACAENLYYGAQAISTAGSADGKYPFFLSTGTPYKDLPHREWMQIVTTDGVTEIMRIYWTFSTLKTLADRFVDATTTAGEDITYRVFVAKTGQDITLYGRWRFSSTAHLSKSQFETNDAANCCFSVDDGAWGAATGTIDANTSPAPQDFWGQGNFDSSDSYGCRQVYMNGVTQNIGNRDGKSYFYYSSVMEPPPTMAPTFSPADLVYFRVQQTIARVSYSDYKLEQTACDTALKRTIAACMIGVSEANLIDYSVIDASAIRAPSNSAAEASKPTSPSPTSSLLRNNIANGLRRMLFAPRQLTPTGRIQITYSIHVYNASLSYQQLTNQLSEAVSNSTFNTLLRQNAQSLGTAVFAAAVATDVTTTDLGGIDEGSGSSGGGGGVDLGMELVDFITFIVVFGAMILMVLFGIFLSYIEKKGLPNCLYCCCCGGETAAARGPSEEPDEESSVSTTASAAMRRHIADTDKLPDKSDNQPSAPTPISTSTPTRTQTRKGRAYQTVPNVPSAEVKAAPSAPEAAVVVATPAVAEYSSAIAMVELCVVDDADEDESDEGEYKLFD